MQDTPSVIETGRPAHFEETKAVAGEEQAGFAMNKTMTPLWPTCNMPLPWQLLSNAAGRQSIECSYAIASGFLHIN